MERKEELKSYYAEITLPDTSFVEMVLLDGVFIIELFLQMSDPDLDKGGDVTFLQSIDLMNDLYRPGINIIRGLGVKHLHDLLRKTIIDPLQSESPSLTLPSAQQRLSTTMLYEAGVKFKVRKSKSFLDITFDKGELYMPRFIFDRDTETFARNLMAYEQCLYQDYTSHTHLCDYFYFMDSLINTSKDVDLLVKSRIIINRLGENDEVATLVNNLTKNIQIDVYRFSYAKLCSNLYIHCNFSWKARLNRDYLSTLKRDYLSTPWKVASTIAAIILLLLTLIQTVCSLVSLFK